MQIDDSLIQKIVHEVELAGGATIDIKTGTIIKDRDEWYFPRWPDITAVVDKSRLAPALAEFMSRHRDKLDDNVYLGVWLRGGRCYIDLNAHVKNFSDARRLAASYSQGHERQIISAYNPAKDQTKYFD